MAAPPVYAPDVDLVTPVPVVDFAPARVSYLRDAATRQHAVMSAWIGPPICRSLYFTSTGAGTSYLTVRVPPGVTDIDVAVLLWGIGTLTITTSADSTGVAFVSTAAVDTDVDEESAIWLSTGGLVSATAAGSGRALTVASSASWVWQNVDLTLTVSDVTTRFGCLAIETRPLHVPR